VRRRQILKGLGWLAGGAIACVPGNVYLPSISREQIERAMRAFGYLRQDQDSDAMFERAFGRFTRHLGRPYRVSPLGAPEDVAPVHCSSVESMIFEIKQWAERGWRVPVGRFKFASLAEKGQAASTSLRWSILREDAAVDWRAAMKDAEARGATLAEPYGDTYRPLGFSQKDGTSHRSFHMCGRAVDLNQAFAMGVEPRYFVSAERDRGQTYFRLLCRTVKQDGAQGRYYQAGAAAWYMRWAGRHWPLAAGWYVDLTDLLASAHFERVAAQPDWEHHNNRAEWWHYQYSVDKQETFLDECELVGMSEAHLLATGYSIEEMDKRPG